MPQKSAKWDLSAPQSSVCKFRILALIVTADELPLIDLTVRQSI